MLSKVLLGFSSLLVAFAQQPQAKAPAPTIQTEFTRADGGTVNTGLSVQFNREDLQFSQKDGVAEARINFMARVTTADGRRIGRSIEEILLFRGPVEQLAALQTGKAVYRTTVQLTPGHYKLTMAAKDVLSGSVAVSDVEFDVPAL